MAVKELKSIILELGAKASLIVLDDADLEGTAAATTGGSNCHTGQVWVIVTESVAARFEIRKKTYAKLYPSSFKHQAADAALSVTEKRMQSTSKNYDYEYVQRRAHPLSSLHLITPMRSLQVIQS